MILSSANPVPVPRSACSCPVPSKPLAPAYLNWLFNGLSSASSIDVSSSAREDRPACSMSCSFPLRPGLQILISKRRRRRRTSEKQILTVCEIWLYRKLNRSDPRWHGCLLDKVQVENVSRQQFEQKCCMV